jgi:hypothetical protein
VPNVHIQLNGPGLQVDTYTDETGSYRFEEPVPPGVGFEVDADEAEVWMLLEDGPAARYQFLYEDDVATLRSRPFPLEGETCKKDLAFGADLGGAIPATAEEWRDLWALHRQLRAALFVAEDILAQPLDYGLPLKITTLCSRSIHEACDGTRGAFYDGTSFGGRTIERPGIYLEPAESTGKGLVTDDTLYHEFGHAFMADAFDDAIPTDHERKPHQGYYVNSSSNDAWVEGWASFFAVMVSQATEGRLPRFRFRTGSERDLEVDIRAWDGNGRDEELAVAGTLLDLVDGPADYASLNPGVVPADDVKYIDLRSPGGARIIVGKIMRLSRGSLARLFVEFLDNGRLVASRSLWLSGDSEELRSGAGIAFWVPVPSQLSYDSVRITGLKVAEVDDDPVDLELFELWASIVGGSGTHTGGAKPDGYAHIFDVADLYEVVSRDFGGEDLDGDGTDDIDQVFIAHRLFADANGSRSFDDGEEVGLTSHPPLGPDGTSTGASVIRYNAKVMPEMKATVTSDVEATVVAFVDEPAVPSRSYSYLAGSTSEAVDVLVPSSDGASVTLMALASGHLPEVIATVEAEPFWEMVQSQSGTSFLEFDVSLRPGEVRLEGTSELAAWLLLAGGVVTTAAGTALWSFRTRKRAL